MLFIWRIKMTKNGFPFLIIEEWKKEKKLTEKRDVNRKTLLPLLIILIIFSILSCYKQYEKRGDHVDEKLTYTHANGTGNYSIPLNQKSENPREALDKYLTTNEYNPPFNYGNVWENQHKDTHPPLYYVLVHTICSLFYGKYSNWFASIINWAFGIATIIFVYHICLIFLDSEIYALICALLFAIHPAIIEMTTFLRMYVMVTFFCVLLSYWIIRNWGNFNLHFFAGNILILICGTLTHYYFIVYAFFCYAVVALYMLVLKDKRSILRFFISLCIAVCITITCFNGIVEHIFKGGHGTQNIRNFFNLSDYAERVTQYFKSINQDLFHNTFPIFLIVALVGYIILWKNNENTYKWRLVLIVSTIIGYFITVSKVATFITDRYISLIYPLLIIAVLIGVFYLVSYLAKEQKIFTYLLGAMLLFAEIAFYQDYTWKYSGIFYRNEIEPKIYNVSQYDCICILNEGWNMWPHYQEFIQYPSLTMTNMEEIDKMDMSQFQNEKVVVYVPSSLYFDNEKMLEIFNQYTISEEIYKGYGYYDCYCLYE